MRLDHLGRAAWQDPRAMVDIARQCLHCWTMLMYFLILSEFLGHRQRARQLSDRCWAFYMLGDGLLLTV